jgi:hypothetical protein
MSFGIALAHRLHPVNQGLEIFLPTRPFITSAEIVVIAPTTTKSDNRSLKTLQLKLSNKPKNELNKH